MQMRRTSALVVAAMCALAAPALAQGKGHGGKGAGKDKGGGQAHEQKAHGAAEHKARGVAERGRAQVKTPEPAARREQQKRIASDKAPGKRTEVFGGEVKRGNAFGKSLARGRFVRKLDVEEIAPPARVYVMSVRPEERLVGKAVALAFARGVPDNALVIAPVGPRYLVRNSAGVVLLDLDDAHARNPGYWKVVTLDDRLDDKAPSFCRSGAGHPVWGRQWCLDKGFGLGTYQDSRWGRTVDPRDVVFLNTGLNTGTRSLTRDVLLGVLGDAVLNRLGLHALTLGYTDPLTGRWLGDGSGSRVLLVSSGSYPVAEVVDRDGDNRADNLLVALRPW